ncbi:MAG TPA: response regulator [Actinomycetota bacterium]|nr:response regulator [Actinomycetota bacterium]
MPMFLDMQPLTTGDGAVTDDGTSREGPAAAMPGVDPGGGGESLLVVDDDPFIARLLEIELKAAGYDVRVASDGEQALAAARERPPQLVLADVMMPNMDGFELTRRLRQDPTTATVSVIMLTARGLSADKLEGFAIGADDYIVKPFDTPELLARIRGVLNRASDTRSLSPMTGLAGNVAIEDEIERRVASAEAFAILYADLDGFKAYNDRYGFLRGDEVIRETARVIGEATAAVVGAETFVGHAGGDDFVVVVPPEHATATAQRIVQDFDEMVPGLYDVDDRANGYVEVTNRRGDPQRFPLLTLSIGVASTEKRAFRHYAEAVTVAMEMKQYTKETGASSWSIDRRSS